MRCLYVVSHHPISPHYRGGGSAIYYEQLASLAALGHEVHLWHYAYPASRAQYEAAVDADPDTAARVRSMCRSVTLTTFPDQVGLKDRVQARVQDIYRGARVPNPLFRTVAHRELRRLVEKISPDVIWAQHIGPGQLAVLQDHVPVVYTHHDWVSTVKALAAGRQPDPAERRHEERVATAATAVVSGSASECEGLRQIGCRHVSYIPLAYESVPWRASNGASTSPRLVHLGGMATTANRLGLERFFEAVWPSIAQPRPELLVIGDLTGVTPALQRQLGEARCTGFAANLTPLMEPYDLHIVAWEHDTGTRTRLPLVFGYGQVLVAVRAAVAGSPEARDGFNCRLVERLDEMASVIDELRRDRAQRQRLALAARQTYEAEFVREAILPRYSAVLDFAIAKSEHGNRQQTNLVAFT
jgi:glycosyltransferase involved in cell wall biosynthesis